MTLFSWLRDHPEAWAPPLLGALFTFITKPRSPEQWEWWARTFHPHVANGLRLLATVLPDLVKAAKIAREIKSGSPLKVPSLPPPPEESATTPEIPPPPTLPSGKDGDA